MSDGPNRPPNVDRGWRRVAKSVGTDASATEEVSQFISSALAGQWRNEVPAALLAGLRKHFDEDLQGRLFGSVECVQIEALRGLAAGRPMAQLLLDYTIEVLSEAVEGRDVLREAIVRTLLAWALRQSRIITEHNIREAGCDYADITQRRIRTALAGCNLANLADQLLGNDPAPVVRRPLKQTGLDDGPRLGP